MHQTQAQTPPATPTVPPLLRFPPQIKYIIGNEACERFSYYGMLSILTVYLSKQMGRGDDNAREIVHLFATAVYFLPLFGAWLADRWLRSEEHTSELQSRVDI